LPLGGLARLTFCALDGAPLRDTYVRDMLNRAGAKAGITKPVHPHGLRRFYASGLVREQVSLNVISKALGHSSSAITSRYLDRIAPAEVIAMGRARGWTAGADPVAPYSGRVGGMLPLYGENCTALPAIWSAARSPTWRGSSLL
jgi:Phage integrase family